MNDFGSAVARFLPKKTYLRVLLATLILTFGVYFAFPPFGITACFPIPLVCGALSFLVLDRIAFAAVAGPIAFFYGMMMGYPSPLLFGAALFCACLCGAVLVKAAFALREKRERPRALWGLIPALVIGLCIPLFFAGDPFRYASQRARVEEYLETVYPEQHFDKVQLYYDPTLTAYRATVCYSSGEGELESELIFAEDVLDGYYEDYAEFVLLKSKTDLIEAFRASEVSCIVEGVGLAVAEDEPIPGTYGTLSDEAVALTSFSVTLREETVSREAFETACRDALFALKRGSVEYGRITFYGLERGMTVYSLEVSYDTDPESISSLIR